MGAILKAMQNLMTLAFTPGLTTLMMIAIPATKTIRRTIMENRNIMCLKVSRRFVETRLVNGDILVVMYGHCTHHDISNNRYRGRRKSEHAFGACKIDPLQFLSQEIQCHSTRKSSPAISSASKSHFLPVTGKGLAKPKVVFAVSQCRKEGVLITGFFMICSDGGDSGRRPEASSPCQL